MAKSITKGNQSILEKKKRILITSALPYVNNVPHLGNIIGCVLSADVFARFCRSYGCDTLFICGTDEHGTTTEAKAIEEGTTPQKISDKYFKIHQEIYKWFGCSFDKFGRTTSPENKEITYEIFRKLDRNGYIIEDELEQMYDPHAQKYLADRFVEGTCPKCGFDSARGDQCDNCGILLNPADLRNPVSTLTGETPEIRKERHLFINLPALEPQLRSWINSKKKTWSKNAVAMTEGWLKTGLKPRCISRDLKWGFPIPRKGYEHKVFYSWFDAPIGYIGITKEKTRRWKQWWHNPDAVELYQFMGKDNIPFHTIMFPSFLLGADDNYTLLHQISSTEYLNYEDGQFSKSRSIGVFGDQAVNSGIPADVWRYYLLSTRPETSDSQFSWKEFQARCNSELLANLGNFVNRTLTFISKNYNNVIPSASLGTKEEKFLEECSQRIEKIAALVSTISLRDALKEIMNLSRAGNQYFQETKPWETITKEKEQADRSMFICANLVRKLAIVIEPYLPNTSAQLHSLLNLQQQRWEQIDEDISDHKIKRPEILFRKLEDQEIEEFKRRYSGRQEQARDISTLFPLDLRVGKIVDVQDHPSADSLYVLTVDFGDTTKNVVAGIKRHFTPQQLKMTHAVFCTNIKPVKLRGELSEAMILVADDKKNVALLNPGAARPGEQAYVEGYANSHQEVAFDQFQKVVMTVSRGKVYYQGKKLVTKKGDVLVERIKEGARIC